MFWILTIIFSFTTVATLVFSRDMRWFGFLSSTPLALVAAFVVLGAFGLYVKLGHSELVNLSTDQTLLNPQDAKGWRRLGMAQFLANHFEESANSFAKAIALEPENLDTKSSHAEALVMAAQGTVTPAAKAIFDQVLEANPREARSLFYDALAFEQAGNFDTARDRWRVMLQDAPPDAPWRKAIEEHVQKLASSTDDQMVMIKSMVAGLAAKLEDDPQNEEGWIKLMKSYMVLKETAKAKATLQLALEKFKGNTSAIRNAAESLNVPK
jgi:cytochrome c-type biogenesis protein CcmH